MIGRGAVERAAIVVVLILTSCCSMCVQAPGDPRNDSATGPTDPVSSDQRTPLIVTTTRESTSPSAIPGGGDGAASTLPVRVRERLCSSYPESCGVPYALELSIIDQVWLHENVYGALAVEVQAHFRTPAVNGTFIFWNDTAYAMPEDFNRFARDANLSISTAADARGVAEFYVTISGGSGSDGFSPTVVLNSSKDIPETSHALSPGVSEKVRPPEIASAGDGFQVVLFSWSPAVGVVREWRMRVTEHGEVAATSMVIGEPVDAGVLDTAHDLQSDGT